MQFIKWLSELSRNDIAFVGGKAANLGEMFNAGLPVPDAFVVTTDAYKYFLEKTGLREKIFEILRRTDVDNTKQLQENTAKIRGLIENAETPQRIKVKIIEAYKKLSRKFGKEEEYVAVRSSATAEDVPGASFAGQQLTLLNVKGAKEVVKAVQKCWASLFTARATFYRVQKGFEHEKVLIAIPVQKQLGALSREDYLAGKYKAGVGFTLHPATGEKNKIVIEASWGQGESVVSGAVTPDTYVIDKETGKVIETHVGTKEKMRITKPGGDLEETETPKEMRKVACLTEDELKQLWKLSLKLEKHYKFPQDFEWASENGKVYLVQSRPVTVFYEKKEEEIEVKHKPILKGLAASPGVGIGKVRIVMSPAEIHKVKVGDVLVTKMTNPDLVPAMRKAAAVVTDEGGMTCIGGNTLLLTDKGFIKAQELYEKIKSGKSFKLLTYDSVQKNFAFNRIVACGKNKKEIIRVQVANKKKNEKIDVLDISPDHKFITFIDGELKKVKLDDLLKMRLGVLVPEKIDGIVKVNLRKEIPYILGLAITDGYLKLSSRRGIFTLSQKLARNRIFLAKRFANYIPALIDREVKFYPKIPNGGLIDGRKTIPSSENYNLTVFSKILVEELVKLESQLDKIILEMNEQNLLDFLAGCLDGNGSVSSDRKRLHLYLDPVKFKDFSGVVLALLRLGIHPQICWSRNIYNLQITEKVKELGKLTTRFREERFKERVKYKSRRYFLARQILNNLAKEFNFGGKLPLYLKKNLLIGEEVVSKVIREARKKGINVGSLENILSLPFRQSRVRKIKNLGVDYVFNFEVDGKKEIDKNYVVFTNTLTPILVSNSHAAIVSRELSIPCIVGTGNATKVLKEGMLVTLDARRGLVYEGEIRELIAREKAIEITPEQAAKLKTKTKILMNLGEPELIEKYKNLPFEGIGLMRIEFIIASYIGKHPNYLLKIGREKEFVDKLAEGIAKVAKAIYPRFVVVRFSDFKTNEYRGLKGGKKFEPVEANPMLGWRGVSRYISKEFEKAFRLECKAIKKVRERYKLDNVWVMLPFVRTTWEVERCLKIMEEEGLKRGTDNFKVWIMAEVPSTIFLADEFSKLCDGFSIGSNDLTQLVLGIDRDSAILANMGYFDERNEAVKRAIKNLIEIAHKHKVSVSICGQAPSVYPEFAEFLVECGIDSISVNPDVVAKTRKLIHDIEKIKKL